jgi:hypothetical protein
MEFNNELIITKIKNSEQYLKLEKATSKNAYEAIKTIADNQTLFEIFSKEEK